MQKKDRVGISLASVVLLGGLMVASSRAEANGWWAVVSDPIGVSSTVVSVDEVRGRIIFETISTGFGSEGEPNDYQFGDAAGALVDVQFPQSPQEDCSASASDSSCVASCSCIGSCTCSGGVNIAVCQGWVWTGTEWDLETYGEIDTSC